MFVSQSLPTLLQQFHRGARDWDEGAAGQDRGVSGVVRGPQGWWGGGLQGTRAADAAGVRPPKSQGGSERARRGCRKRGGGGRMSGFFWQRAAGKLAGPVPGSSELRLVPPFHEH